MARGPRTKILTMTHHFRKELFDSDNNFFIWTISGIKKLINSDSLEMVNTDVLKLSPYGYDMAFQAKFDMDHIGIYVLLVPGKFDKLLNWPYSSAIQISLLNQVEGYSNKIIIIDPKNMNNEICWQRPQVNGQQKGCGIKMAFPTNALRKGPNGHPSEFLRNDQIYIRIELLKN